MPLISINFLTGTGFQLGAVLEICKYQRHPQVYWKNSNVVENYLMQPIILSYSFRGKCIGCIGLFSQIHFLTDHHCTIQSESFDTLEKCGDCFLLLQGIFGKNVNLVFFCYSRVLSVFLVTTS